MGLWVVGTHNSSFHAATDCKTISIPVFFITFFTKLFFFGKTAQFF